MAAIGQVAPVSKHSDEYVRLEHLLQLSFRSAGVRDVSAWSISNPALAIAFDRRARNMLTLDCLVDISALDEINAVQDVCKRGFAAPAHGQGLEFSTGSVRTGAHMPPARQFLLCTVAVGRSYVMDDPSGKRELPAGFDSLYLHMPEVAEGGADGAGGSGEDGAEPYRHTYVVFDPAQVLPKYVIHCTYDPAEQPARPPVGGINLAEIKARVADALAVLGPSAPAATEKMLTDIGEAYEHAIEASNTADPLVEERKRSIGDSLRLIDERLRAVQSNSTAVEEALYQKLQEALSQLQDATAKKMNLLLSEELELRRQLAQIEWVESFVPVMQNSLPPMSFISAWERHTAVRAQLSSQLATSSVGSVVRVLDEVQPDLKLAGDIQVTSERATAAAASSAALGSTAAGARFFGAALPAGAADAFALAATPAPALAASGADVSGLWTQLLRQNMGLAPATTDPAAALEQSQAQFALAKASLAAVEAAAQHAPPSLRAAGELARLEAQNKLAEAQAAMTAFGGPSAQTVVPRPPSTARRPSEVVRADAAAATSAAANTSRLPAVVERPVTPPRAASSRAPADQTLGSPAAGVASPSTTTLTRTIPLGERISRFSMAKEAERRQRQLAAAGIPVDSIDPSLAFPESRIITPDQAMSLYLTLPFGVAEDPATGGLGNVPPATHLLFASYNDSPPTIQHFAQLWQMARANTPTLVLIKASTGAVFGGYAADPWDFSDLFGGTPRSFLFSITRDCKLPYHGRVKGPRQPSDDLLRQQHEMAEEQAAAQFQQLVAEARMSGTEQYDNAGRLLVPQYDDMGQMVGVVPLAQPRPRPFVRHDCLKSNAESIQFGLRDLVLVGDLSACSSEIECSYGIGLRPGSTDAQTFLAGAPVFGVEELEIWEVTANPAESVTAGLGPGDADAEQTPAAGQ